MPKIVDHEQYRKKLLEQCFDLFAHKGYASITMRQVAQELGVSTGTLYHYFSNKEALFEQLVEEITSQDILSAAAQLENLPTIAARIEALFNFVAEHEDYFYKQMLIWMDFYQQQEREKVQQNPTFHRLNEQARQAIAQMLEIDDPQLVIMVLSLTEGLIQERLFDPTISWTKQGELLAKMLTAYLEMTQDK